MEEDRFADTGHFGHKLFEIDFILAALVFDLFPLSYDSFNVF